MSSSTKAPGRRAQQDLVVRRRLLDAARDELLERGYHAATLDHIAARADCTKGTVYSKYASKADLVFALLEERQEARRGLIDALVRAQPPGATVGDVLVAIGEQATELNQADAAWRLLVTEFRVVAARDPELQARYVASHDALLDRLEDQLTTVFARSAGRFALDAREAAQLMLALEVGIGLEQEVDPGVLGADVARRLLRQLFQEPT